MHGLAVYCAEIGSVKNGNFAWARGERRARRSTIAETGNDIAELAKRVLLDFEAKQPVALGFECPLFVPVREDASQLTDRREGEGHRAWSASSGAQVLVTGLAQTLWLLRAVRCTGVRAFLDWESFMRAQSGLFLWEAFVTSGAKGRSHTADASIAVRYFWKRFPEILEASAIRERSVHSLIGAALLRTGWSQDLGLLKQPCIVIRP